MSAFLVQDKPVCSAELIEPGSQSKLFLNLICKLLSPKQKVILEYLITAEAIPATRLIESLSKDTNSSPSTIWTHLRILKKLELINFGSAINKGIPLSLTSLGLLVSKYFLDNQDIGEKILGGK